MTAETKEIPRSRIRGWVLDQQTNYAKVIIVKPRDFKAWTAAIERQRVAVEKFLGDSGYTIVDDEGGGDQWMCS